MNDWVEGLFFAMLIAAAYCLGVIYGESHTSCTRVAPAAKKVSLEMNKAQQKRWIAYWKRGQM